MNAQKAKLNKPVPFKSRNNSRRQSEVTIDSQTDFPEIDVNGGDIQPQVQKMRINSNQTSDTKKVMGQRKRSQLEIILAESQDDASQFSKINNLRDTNPIKLSQNSTLTRALNPGNPSYVQSFDGQTVNGKQLPSSRLASPSNINNGNYALIRAKEYSNGQVQVGASIGQQGQIMLDMHMVDVTVTPQSPKSTNSKKHYSTPHYGNVHAMVNSESQRKISQKRYASPRGANVANKSRDLISNGHKLNEMASQSSLLPIDGPITGKGINLQQSPKKKKTQFQKSANVQSTDLIKSRDVSTNQIDQNEHKQSLEARFNDKKADSPSKSNQAMLDQEANKRYHQKNKKHANNSSDLQVITNINGGKQQKRHPLLSYDSVPNSQESKTISSVQQQESLDHGAIMPRSSLEGQSLMENQIIEELKETNFVENQKWQPNSLQSIQGPDMRSRKGSQVKIFGPLNVRGLRSNENTRSPQNNINSGQTSPNSINTNMVKKGLIKGSGVPKVTPEILNQLQNQEVSTKNLHQLSGKQIAMQSPTRLLASDFPVQPVVNQGLKTKFIKKTQKSHFMKIRDENPINSPQNLPNEISHLLMLEAQRESILQNHQGNIQATENPDHPPSPTYVQHSDTPWLNNQGQKSGPNAIMGKTMTNTLNEQNLNLAQEQKERKFGDQYQTSLDPDNAVDEFGSLLNGVNVNGDGVVQNNYNQGEGPRSDSQISQHQIVLHKYKPVKSGGGNPKKSHRQISNLKHKNMEPIRLQQFPNPPHPTRDDYMKSDMSLIESHLLDENTADQQRLKSQLTEYPKGNMSTRKGHGVNYMNDTHSGRGSPLMFRNMQNDPTVHLENDIQNNQGPGSQKHPHNSTSPFSKYSNSRLQIYPPIETKQPMVLNPQKKPAVHVISYSPTNSNRGWGNDSHHHQSKFGPHNSGGYIDSGTQIHIPQPKGEFNDKTKSNEANSKPQSPQGSSTHNMDQAVGGTAGQGGGITQKELQQYIVQIKFEQANSPFGKHPGQGSQMSINHQLDQQKQTGRNFNYVRYRSVEPSRQLQGMNKTKQNQSVSKQSNYKSRKQEFLNHQQQLRQNKAQTKMDIKHSNGDVVQTQRLKNVASSTHIERQNLGEKGEIKSSSANQTFGLGVVDSNEQTTILNGKISPDQDSNFIQAVDRERRQNEQDQLNQQTGNNIAENTADKACSNNDVSTVQATSKPTKNRDESPVDSNKDDRGQTNMQSHQDSLNALSVPRLPSLKPSNGIDKAFQSSFQRFVMSPRRERGQNQGAAVSALLYLPGQKRQDQQPSSHLASLGITLDDQSHSQTNQTSPREQQLQQPRAVSHLQMLENLVAKMHKDPIEQRINFAPYEQRVLNKDRKWKQDFGRKIQGSDFALKDYSKDLAFINPLQPSEQQSLGISNTIKPVDEILKIETRRKYNMPVLQSPRRSDALKMQQPNLQIGGQIAQQVERPLLLRSPSKIQSFAQLPANASSIDLSNVIETRDQVTSPTPMESHATLQETSTVAQPFGLIKGQNPAGGGPNNNILDKQMYQIQKIQIIDEKTEPNTGHQNNNFQKNNQLQEFVNSNENPRVHKFAIENATSPQSVMASSLNQTFLRDNQPTGLGKNSPLNMHSPVDPTMLSPQNSSLKLHYPPPSHTPLLSKPQMPTQVQFENRRLVEKEKTTTQMVNHMLENSKEMSSTVKDGLYYGARVS